MDPLSLRFPPAAHGLCRRQGSSAETAPEEAEGPDAEFSDDADHSSKVSGFCFRFGPRDSAAHVWFQPSTARRFRF